MNYIRITKENIDKEHICCAMSGKQSVVKKEWMKQRFEEGCFIIQISARLPIIGCREWKKRQKSITFRWKSFISPVKTMHKMLLRQSQLMLCSGMVSS